MRINLDLFWSAVEAHFPWKFKYIVSRKNSFLSKKGVYRSGNLQILVIRKFEEEADDQNVPSPAKPNNEEQ